MTADIEAAKFVDLLDLAGRYTNLKKVSSTGGGEWAGPCPMPGCNCDRDGFRVQPNHPGGGVWFCRGCGENRWHDAIDFVMKHDAVDFKSALLALGGDDVGKHNAPPPPPPGTDRTKWTEAALDFIETSLGHLRGAEGTKARAYLHKRGLNDETLAGWCIGYNPEDVDGDPRKWGTSDKVYIPRGIVIPNQDDSRLHYVKIRKPVGEPKYLMVTGSKGWLFGGMSCKGKSEAFLFEGEFDALLAWQTGLAVGCCSIPAGYDLKPEYSRYFQDTEHLIVAFDNDDPGHKGAAKICAHSNLFYNSGPLPQGKDLTEYAQAGGDILDWMLQQINKTYGVTS